MAIRYKQQRSNMLQIRGFSRGSPIDNSKLDITRTSLSTELRATNEEHYIKEFQHGPNSGSDDESTITGGSGTAHKGLHSEDSMTESDSSHYWSAANSSTTGNTTERSSVYSWGDDEFDNQASRVVQQLFHGIEKMLFESVLSGSSLLQHECREWMEAFPHLRILGKQSIPTRDEGFQSLSSSRTASDVGTPTLGVYGHMEENFDISNDMNGLSVSGSGLTPSPVPLHYLMHSDSSGVSTPGSDLSHLHEEIFEEDGEVEEYLAYDIRELDEEETAKRYHVPRRRRLGYPPITPNACVRDAVLNNLFDITWAKLVGCIDKSSGASKRNLKSLWKVLFDNYMLARQENEISNLSNQRVNDSYLYQSKDGDKVRYSGDRDDFDDFSYTRQVPEISIDRHTNTAMGLSYSHNFPSIGYPTLGPSRFHTHDMLPPSRGSYLDQGLSSGRQFHSPARLTTAPHPSDFASLNDVMKISQKKLQVRSDRSQGLQSEDSIGSFGNHHLDGGILGNPSVVGPSSPLVIGGRSYLSLPGPTYSRQHSAKQRRAAGRPARLLPLALDRVKSPVGFDDIVKATKLRIPFSGASNMDSEAIGIRVTSPPQPPTTAPAMSGGNLWLNSRLPPIPLEALNEDSSLELKKPRGRTAHSRISSAIAGDPLIKQTSRVWENVSRPNTTHAFRTDIPYVKRASSVTPSNFSVGNFRAPFSIQGPKSASPSGLPVLMGSFGGATNQMYSQNFSHSPDNQGSGFAGITGVGMLGPTHSSLSHSPNDPDLETRPVQSSWGNPVRRKRTVIGT